MLILQSKIDKGHCKMAYDDSEDPAELLHFYDFEPLQEATNPTISSSNELVLQSGHRLGHRHDLRFFKQRLRRNNVRSFTGSQSILVH